MIALGTVVLASAFGTFVLFLLLGLLALPVTAALDKSLGKEKGLLLYALVLLAFTFFVLRPESTRGGAVRAGKETDVQVDRLVQKGDPFARAGIEHDGERNPFRPYSDTRPLPPVTLEAPPWIALDFALPPTVPGPAPGHRQVLRGALPKLSAGDGTQIAEIPDAVFSDYQRKPEDVYDWVMQGGKPFYVYIVAIADGAGWHNEGSEEYERLKWVLARQEEGFEDLRLKVAYVGFESTAARYLEDLDILERRRKGVTEKLGRDEDENGWHLRRTVDNLYAEALMRQGYGPTDDIREVRPIHPEKLRRAARDMAEVGRSGKERRAGWRKVVELLEVALIEVRANRGDDERAELLLELLEAQRALQDEQAELRTLAEYMRTAPRSAEARTWLGQLHLEGMQLPTEALHYFDAALDRDRRYAPALVGHGDALSTLGRHEEALRSYADAGSDEGRLGQARALLRLGRLDRARDTAESALARDPALLGATHVRACALYALGDLETARGAFEAVAGSAEAHHLRAMACYNLGLTCLRLGQHDAALAAFDGCAKALQQGSRTGLTPDETVSPSFGRALVAYAAGDMDAMRRHLELARLEAPRSSYLAMFTGMVASLEGNDASAIRALDGALAESTGYGELDGWLGKTYLRLGRLEAETKASAAETAATFERAIAFAARAADRESRADRTAWAARLREALVRIGAVHLPTKQRYGQALAAAEKVLNVSETREQPAALAIAAYCNYQLGRYDECIRKFQQVLDVVPDKEEHEWYGWRGYSQSALQAVKHWRSLEEKLVAFKETNLGRDWDNDQSNAVRALVEDGVLRFRGQARKDGRRDDPTVWVSNSDLFGRDTFESVTLTLRIPREGRGRAMNNIAFGVEVVAGSRSRSGGGKRSPGMGVWYDKNKLAVRVQGGQIKEFKDGDVQRLDPEQSWPEGDEVTVRIVREDGDKGVMAIYLDDELVLRDSVSTFRSNKGKAALWIGGYASQTQPFDVTISDIRVVRKKD